MTNPQLSLESLDSAALLAATRELVQKSHAVEADLLVHLGEIDDRKLYAQCSYPSMFAFCLEELGFSECAAYNRITVARIGRRLPAVIEALRSGRVHLAGLRILAPHLNLENHELILSHATGRSKREIEELAARLWPMPPIPTSIRKLPENPIVKTGPLPLSRSSWGSVDPSPLQDGPQPAPSEADAPGRAAAPSRESLRTVVAPLSGDTFRIQFSASRQFRDKLQAAQDLLRHRLPDGDVPTILEQAIDLLIAKVKKERFAVGRKPRAASPEEAQALKTVEEQQTEAGPEVEQSTQQAEAPLPSVSSDPTQAEDPAKPSGAATAAESTAEGEGAFAEFIKATSRHIPDAIKRAVYERDGGRCTWVDERGRRCDSTSGLVFDHKDGFALTHTHSIAGIRLLCWAHNQYAAEQMYGREFMEHARAAAREGAASPATRPGASGGNEESSQTVEQGPGSGADATDGRVEPNNKGEDSR